VHSVVALPFGPLGTAAAWGENLVVGLTELPEVKVFDRKGTLQTVIRWADPQIRVTDDVVTRFVEERLAYSGSSAAGADAARLRRWLQGYEFPSTVPAYSKLIADADGLLWVRRYRIPSSPVATWLGFNRRGEWVMDMDVPNTWRILELAETYLLAVTRDTLDVERVVRYRLNAAS
jgi:hypothetical protein